MGEAPPHKDNLIGSAAGGVLKSVCLKLVTSSKNRSLPALAPLPSWRLNLRADDLEASLDSRL